MTKIIILFLFSYALIAQEIAPKVVIKRQDLPTTFKPFEIEKVIEGGGGSGVGNGGHLIRCNGKELITFDYYEAKLSAQNESIKIYSPYTMAHPLESFLEKIKIYLRFDKIFYKALTNIGSPELWIPTSLAGITDDLKSAYTINNSLCKNGEIIQVVIRQGSSVFYDPEIFNHLSTFQQELLILHETLYFLGEKYNAIKTSPKVRQVIRQLLTQEPYDSSLVTDPYHLSKPQKLTAALTQLMGDNFNLRYNPLLLNRSFLKSEYFWSEINIQEIEKYENLPRQCFGYSNDKIYPIEMELTVSKEANGPYLLSINTSEDDEIFNIPLQKKFDPDYMFMALGGEYKNYDFFLTHNSTNQLFFRIINRSVLKGTKNKFKDALGICL